MAVREERVLARPQVAAPRIVLATRRHAVGLLGAVAVAVAAGAFYAVRLDLPGFFDNEGRYAEVAREMVLRRDFLTPHLDFTLFLNKPPLTFWLAALVFEVAGPTEWARLVSVLGAVVTIVTTIRLGALCYGEAAGVVAGLALATSLGFVLEARTLRPDMLLTAAVTVALFCWRRALLAGRRRDRWLVGLYVALGLGMLAKAMVPLLLVAVPIAVVTLRERGWRGLGELRPGLGLLITGAVVLPWHLLVSLEHPGFAWDYVVNQHLLFFFDRKFPRDGPGDPLWFFWTAYAGRALPWIVLLPFTLREAVRGFGRRAAPAEQATSFLWIWAGWVIFIFSCAASRLEHYSIPALPAGAILVGRVWQRAKLGELPDVGWRVLGGIFAGLAALGLVAIAVGPDLVARTYWIAQAPDLPGLAALAGGLLVVTAVAALAATLVRREEVLFAVLALGMVPAATLVLRAEAAAEPLFSWRPAAKVLRALPERTEIVFEAPQEYQLVAALTYYTGRRITLLEPPGFIPPTYLRPHVAAMFLPRAEFARRWQAGEALALVSDPLCRRDDPPALVPGPARILGRFGDRWVLASASTAVAP